MSIEVSDRRSQCDRLGAPCDATSHRLRGCERARRRRLRRRRWAVSCATSWTWPSRPRFEVLRIKDLIVDPIRPQMRVLAAAVSVVSADRLRQRRQPASGARHRETARDWRATRDRRRAWTDRPADSDREQCAGDGRWSGWRRRLPSARFASSRSSRLSRRRACFSSRSISAAAVFCRASSELGVDGALLLIGARDCAWPLDWYLVWRRPCTSHGQNAARAIAAGGSRDDVPQSGGARSPQPARRDASQPGDGAAGRGRSARAQLRQAAGGRISVSIHET